MKKRVELASRATADLLNNSIFNLSGPVEGLAGYLGAAGEHAGECLLRSLVPEGCTQSIFPLSDNEAAAKPFLASDYNPELHLAVGMLRIFNAEENSAEEGGEPYCDFRSAPYITGAAALDAYGPLFLVIAKHILPRLCPMLGKMLCGAKTPAEVHRAMNATFTR